MHALRANTLCLIFVVCIVWALDVESHRGGAIMKARRPASPTLLNEEQWNLIAADVAFLQMLRAATSILQPRTARAAQVIPVFRIFEAEMRAKLGDPTATAELKRLLALALGELDRVEDFHLKKEWAKNGGSGAAAKFEKVCRNAGVTSYWDFLRLAAFAIVGPSETMGLSGEEIRQQFAKWCFNVDGPAGPRGHEAIAQKFPNQYDKRNTHLLFEGALQGLMGLMICGNHRKHI